MNKEVDTSTCEQVNNMFVTRWYHPVTFLEQKVTASESLSMWCMLQVTLVLSAPQALQTQLVGAVTWYQLVGSVLQHSGSSLVSHVFVLAGRRDEDASSVDSSGDTKAAR